MPAAISAATRSRTIVTVQREGMDEAFAYPPNALRVGGAVQPPTKIYNVAPVYPADAQQARVQGIVVSEVLIDETGAVTHVNSTNIRRTGTESLDYSGTADVFTLIDELHDRHQLFEPVLERRARERQTPLALDASHGARVVTGGVFRTLGFVQNDIAKGMPRQTLRIAPQDAEKIGRIRPLRARSR